MGKISLIIVNFNGRSFLGDLLKSVDAQSRRPEEIILVDNASTDGSVEYIQFNFPWVKIVSLDSNVGFAEGNNIGLTHTKYDYIGLLNSDTIIDKNCFAEMAKALDSDPKLGAVVPKIYGKEGFPTIHCTGAEFNNIGHYWGRGFKQNDHGQFDVATEVPGITACAALVRREALGGEALFDPDFFMYNEEFDLSLRLHCRNFPIKYLPQAIVFHKESQSVKKITDRPLLFSQFFGNRNRMKILTKYYPLSVLVQSFPLIILSLVYWNWIFLKENGWLFFFRAIISQAHYAFKGILERLSVQHDNRQNWLPWMKRHHLKDLLAFKRLMTQ